MVAFERPWLKFMPRSGVTSGTSQWFESVSEAADDLGAGGAYLWWRAHLKDMTPVPSIGTPVPDTGIDLGRVPEPRPSHVWVWPLVGIMLLACVIALILWRKRGRART